MTVDALSTASSITVVVPVYNNAVGVRRSLGALAARLGEHQPLELVVVDDGSTDETPAVVAKAVVPFTDHRIVTTSNQGPSPARNAGAGVASGDFLIFLDANDEPLSGWLAAFGQRVGDGVGIVHCEPSIADPTIRADYGFLLPGCFAVSRNLFEHIGGYDNHLRFAENTDLVERAHRACGALGLDIARVNEPLLVVNDLSDGRRYDALRVDAMSHLLERDAGSLRVDRERMERLARIGAVNAARTGQHRRARHLAWTAIRARPANLRNWVRLLIVATPKLSRRRWRVSAQ